MGLWKRPCAVCEAKDAEIARSLDREALYLGQIADLTGKINSFADARAHVAAERVSQEAREPREKRPQTVKVPSYINTLERNGHLKMNSARKAARPPYMGVKAPPPAQDPIPGPGG
jgi:hypothetical protein